MKVYDARRTTIAKVAARIRGASPDAAVAQKARSIIDAVRTGGDAALKEMAARYDGLAGANFRVPRKSLLEASKRLPPEVLNALRLSKSRIEEFHSRQSLSPFEYRDGCGLYGQKVVPLERVGIYAPGGTAAYGSSVLMACIPARMAGVREIVLCSPPTNGRMSDLVLAAAGMCGADEVYAVGGAQSIAAMAYGTRTIPRVQKIVGPGGVFVSAAKLLVRDTCEIDFLAGPSEILVIADSDASPGFIASDMVAQLEHDSCARAVLVSDSRQMLEATSAELSRLVSRAERKDVVSASYANGAAFVLVRDLSDAVVLSNAIAPEHLLIDVARPRKLLAKVSNAGSVFLGRWSSVAFGDYCAGTNHILPTGGMAAMRSALSVYDFQKIIPYQLLTRQGAGELSGVVESLAVSEGLPCHARAARVRAEKVSG